MADLIPLPAPLAHGGSLAQMRRNKGEHPLGWIDLSSGINPWAYPVPAFPSDRWQDLPGDAAQIPLLARARQFYSVPQHAGIVAGAGSQALLAALPSLFKSTRVAILGYSYKEHEHRWHQAGHEVSVVSGLEAAGRADIAIVVNPNNPDGRVFESGELLRLVEQLSERRGIVIIDEAFADADPACSLVPAAGGPGLVILRSFGKFFGLAGLRLGFAIGPQPICDALEAWLGPWPVTGPAIEIGSRAFADAAWIAATKARLATASSSLRRILTEAKLRVVGGSALFQLIEAAEASRIADRLEEHAILVRRFPDRPHWLRFGLPPNDEASIRLREALSRGTDPLA